MGWLSDIAEHLIYQIKRKYDWKFFLKCANGYFFVSHRSNKRVDDMRIKMSPKNISQWYVMAMSSMREQKLIDYRSHFEKK